MNAHPDLFEWQKAVRRTDPVTSRDAARAAQSLAGRHHAMILACMREAGRPLACEEIGDRLHDAINHVQAGKRMCELERANLIVATEEKHTNRSGRQAFRYRLCEAAA